MMVALIRAGTLEDRTSRRWGGCYRLEIKAVGARWRLGIKAVGGGYLLEIKAVGGR
jgi:hypothetical protein